MVSPRSLAAAIGIALLGTHAAARADDRELDRDLDNQPGTEPPTWLREMRWRARHFEGSLMAAGLLQPPETGFGGATLSLGPRWQGGFDAKGVDSDSEMGAYCAPIACGIFLLALVPRSGWVGNEWGFDIQGSFFIGSDGVIDGRVGLRPHLRVVRQSRVRTDSFLGALLPAVDVLLSDARPAALDLVWSLYPISLRLAPGVALEFDPVRLGVSIPFTSGSAQALAGSSLGVSLQL